MNWHDFGEESMKNICSAIAVINSSACHIFTATLRFPASSPRPRISKSRLTSKRGYKLLTFHFCVSRLQYCFQVCSLTFVVTLDTSVLGWRCWVVRAWKGLKKKSVVNAALCSDLPGFAHSSLPFLCYSDPQRRWIFHCLPQKSSLLALNPPASSPNRGADTGTGARFLKPGLWCRRLLAGHRLPSCSFDRKAHICSSKVSEAPER